MAQTSDYAFPGRTMSETAGSSAGLNSTCQEALMA